MNKILNKSLAAGLLWGITGGVLLILSSHLFSKGYYVILVYALILIAALSTFKPPGEKNIITYFKAGLYTFMVIDRKSTRLNSSHSAKSRMPSSA